AAVELSGQLKALATALMKIANDLRWMNSGPLAGLGEIELPPLQPGSSIMPGKVNPVMAEMTDMVAFQVIGADTVVTMAAQAGQLELNVMMPVIAYNLLFSLTILTNAVTKLATACVDGIVAHPDRCRQYLDDSLGLATVLAPYIGYAAAAEVAKEAVRSGRSIRETVLSLGILTEKRLAEIMEPRALTMPGVPGENS
ncbi:MAG TPA: lyase family protein, partial [Geobacteraceae bacterium]